MDKIIGNQIPTQSVVIPYDTTYGDKAIELYNQTGRTAQEWQELMLYDILAYEAQPDESELWVHTKFGYSVPRRNGKNEILSMRELYGIVIRGESILHTAHRTTTSHAASVRLVTLLDGLGYTEVQRVNKKEVYDKAYTYSKQFGLERVKILGDFGGQCDFRTRSGKGGLGEGFDLLIIDEAQEYTDDQESALKYVVTDSKNPQTLLCGTPPTAVSTGTVFPRLRDSILFGETENNGWAEWSVDEMTEPRNKEAWYKTNPSLGTIFTERSVNDEIGSDIVDFNIQRLGLWLKYNQKSAISENDWKELATDKVPKRATDKIIGIKYGNDGTNVAMSIAFKDADGVVFVECINCRPIRAGNGWIIDFLTACKDVGAVIIDGANGQALLSEDMKSAGLKKPILPTVKEIIIANAGFEQAIYNAGICHRAQPSVVQIATNCEKRTIGTNGGFGYKSLKPDVEVAILDSIILAHWGASELKEHKTQKVRY